MFQKEKVMRNTWAYDSTRTRPSNGRQHQARNLRSDRSKTHLPMTKAGYLDHNRVNKVFPRTNRTKMASIDLLVLNDPEKNTLCLSHTLCSIKKVNCHMTGRVIPNAHSTPNTTPGIRRTNGRNTVMTVTSPALFFEHLLRPRQKQTAGGIDLLSTHHEPRRCEFRVGGAWRCGEGSGSMRVHCRLLF